MFPLHPPGGYLSGWIEKSIGFIAGFLLALIQRTPFRFQTLASITLVFMLWILVKRYILFYVEKKQPVWEKYWGLAIKKLVNFITYTLFFTLFYFTVFLLQQEFIEQNLNVQEIVVIILVFMMILFVAFILYNNRIRRYQTSYINYEKEIFQQKHSSYKKRNSSS